MQKNILLLIRTLSGGGAELVTENLLRFLDRNKYNVYCCVLNQLGCRGEKLLINGYKITTIHCKNKYFSFLKLRNFIIQNKIDLIHSHDTQSLIDGVLSRLFLPNIKQIHTFHFGNYPNLNIKYFYLERLFVVFCDCIISVGNRQSKNVKKFFGHAKRHIIIHNGISPAKPSIPYPILSKNSSITIGSISSFIDQKGIQYLLEAILKLKNDNITNFNLILVGDGPLKKNLIELYKKYSIEDLVIFTGWIDNASSSILPFLDIFVQSSIYEAMSMVILEAMSASKAIVATDVGDNKYVIKDGYEGILVRPKDSYDLFIALRKLILNESLRKFYGKNARVKYLQKYTVIEMINSYDRIYNDFL